MKAKLTQTHVGREFEKRETKKQADRHRSGGEVRMGIPARAELK
jgi:hypothetical protein